jgi:hypothetical protein
MKHIPFQPIKVTEDTIKLLREMGIDLKEDGPMPLFDIKQTSIEPLPRPPVSDLLTTKFKYGEETDS